MNIDLLVTRQGEAGLVSDIVPQFEIAEVHYDALTGMVRFAAADGKHLDLNIPIEADNGESMVRLSEIHFGVVEGDIITVVRQFPLICFNYHADSVSPQRFKPRQSPAAFEIFMRRCTSGQPVHRQDFADEQAASGVLGSVSPSVIKFAPHLAHQRDMELNHGYTPKFVPQLTLGLGESGRISAVPPKPSTPAPVKDLPDEDLLDDEATEDSDPDDIMDLYDPDIEDDAAIDSPMGFFVKKPAFGGEITARNLKTIMKPLTDLIGLTEVKNEIIQIAQLAQSQSLRQSAGLERSSISMHMAFTGAPGTGKTTVARELGRVLARLGYLAKGHVIETDRAGMVESYAGGTAKRTRDAVLSALGGILFIDEAYTLVNDEDSSHGYGREAINTLLKMMEDHRGQFIVIAAGYGKGMTKFLDSNPGLRSRFAMTIDFPDYTPDEMVRIFKKMSDENGFVADDAAIEKVRRHVQRLNTSGEINSFGNARGVRNIFERGMVAQAGRVVTQGARDRESLMRLTADDILKSDRAADAISHDELEELLQPLNQMVGMDNVKKDMADLAHLLQAQIMRQKKNLPHASIVLHSIFSGPPGTGKTSAARLLGKILKRLGYLEKGHVVEVDKSALVSKWVGSTPDIVKNLVTEAEGGILFIDEAYALDDANYGREALATLLKLMEDRRGRMVVICAGYQKEIDEFIDSNPGLKSRFPRHFNFETYNPQQLASIFSAICEEQGYKPTAEALEKLKSYIEMLDNDMLDKLGNARLMRNIFEKTLPAQARRIIQNRLSAEEDIVSIEAADLQLPDLGEAKKIGFL